jgi:hypothetical protein
MRLCRYSGMQQPRQHRRQVKPSVKAVGKLSQIAVAVLGVVNAVIRTADRSLHIAQHSIDPAKARMLHMRKASGAVRDNLRPSLQILTSPILERGNRKARDQLAACKQRFAISAGLYCRHKRRLVQRPTSTIDTAGPLATKISIIAFNSAPPNLRGSSRSIITCTSLCFISQAVL